MELRPLLYVEAVARLGSFTAAAHELHVVQPAVSAQVAALERRLGTSLFVRTSTGARPTDAGRVVAAHVRRIQAELGSMESQVSDLSGLVTGDLRIGATPLLGPIDLPRLTGAFRAEHPGVRLHVRTALIGELVTALEEGAVDVVLGPVDLAPESAARLDSHVVHRESLVLIVPPGLDVGSLSDVADQPFVCLPAGSGLRRLLDEACAAHGFRPRVDIEVGDPHRIPEYVAAGVGVAVVAESVARRAAAGRLRPVPLDPEPEHPPLGIMTTRRPSPAAAAFTTLATSSARSATP